MFLFINEIRLKLVCKKKLLMNVQKCLIFKKQICRCRRIDNFCQWRKLILCFTIKVLFNTVECDIEGNMLKVLLLNLIASTVTAAFVLIFFANFLLCVVFLYRFLFVLLYCFCLRLGYKVSRKKNIVRTYQKLALVTLLCWILSFT